MSKITLLEENCYVLRSTKTAPDGAVQVRYYMTPSTWTRAPHHGTIFHDFDIGEAHLRLLQTRDLRGAKGWADGSTEVFDVVPLYGEILQSPNGTTFEVKR
ncbi:hypothetical protein PAPPERLAPAPP_02260 [Brevundimonas phage vB_BpoS-Papperlapapp]|uniref:Uncharacterized protein n=2 Tax=Marchewkavirus TaxID=3425052 RepID=A0A9E7SJK5_9CAUD|nr:hypothetical protein KABACHOK_00640 [Brevundimonas phage vB_BpoS-Kabachok]USN14597.1 hypothetical protein DOMOVOI_01230 [Brevundimonas phage vB_BpoS-Domovoi]USN15967.1 hypothetical protein PAPPERLAPAPP_02260 [Brevundimonas phage vB_BpoS-Papperlapapp]